MPVSIQESMPVSAEDERLSRESVDMSRFPPPNMDTMHDRDMPTATTRSPLQEDTYEKGRLQMPEAKILTDMTNADGPKIHEDIILEEVEQSEVTKATATIEAEEAEEAAARAARAADTNGEGGGTIVMSAILGFASFAFFVGTLLAGYALLGGDLTNRTDRKIVLGLLIGAICLALVCGFGCWYVNT